MPHADAHPHRLGLVKWKELFKNIRVFTGRKFVKVIVV
jgi:hypothetical protein